MDSETIAADPSVLAADPLFRLSARFLALTYQVAVALALDEGAKEISLIINPHYIEEPLRDLKDDDDIKARYGERRLYFNFLALDNGGDASAEEKATFHSEQMVRLFASMVSFRRTHKSGTCLLLVDNVPCLAALEKLHKGVMKETPWGVLDFRIVASTSIQMFSTFVHDTIFPLPLLSDDPSVNESFYTEPLRDSLDHFFQGPRRNLLTMYRQRGLDTPLQVFLFHRIVCFFMDYDEEMVESIFQMLETTTRPGGPHLDA